MYSIRARQHVWTSTTMATAELNESCVWEIWVARYSLKKYTKHCLRNLIITLSSKIFLEKPRHLSDSMCVCLQKKPNIEEKRPNIFLTSTTSKKNQRNFASKKPSWQPCCEGGICCGCQKAPFTAPFQLVRIVGANQTTYRWTTSSHQDARWLRCLWNKKYHNLGKTQFVVQFCAVVAWKCSEKSTWRKLHTSGFTWDFCSVNIGKRLFIWHFFLLWCYCGLCHYVSFKWKLENLTGGNQDVQRNP